MTRSETQSQANAPVPAVEAVAWRDGRLVLLDQRRLPETTHYLELDEPEAVAEAIRSMAVRGAPAIGIAAAYGLVLAARRRYAAGGDWRAALQRDRARLAAARPTAVNLRWALDRLSERLAAIEGDPEPELLAEARRIHEADRRANIRMAETGVRYLGAGSRVLTHCNTGALATGGHGTALGVIRTAWVRGSLAGVYADETRPWLQGTRLTAWELAAEGIPVSVICEGAAASLMAAGEIDWVIVGADRITANGDVVNKIGTYSLAVLARHHGVRFMVVAPSSTVDLATASGAEVPIEARPAEEVLGAGGVGGAEAWNPVFDVTPATLVDVLVTERGAVERPDARRMAELMAAG